MAGLYFHIPFCRRICAYCDFFKSAEVGRVDSVLDAMGRELDGAVDWLADRRIRTVYFGGGTPSLCDPARLQGLADRAATLLDCSGVEEFTVEANPDDMTEEWLEALARTGANRLSVGVQSFDDDELRLMNRRHTGCAGCRGCAEGTGLRGFCESDDRPDLRRSGFRRESVAT